MGANIMHGAPVGVVIGASSGIGAAVADLLSQEGFQVLAASRRGTCPARDCTAVVCDVRRAIDLTRLMDEAQHRGRVEWVVNAAGVGFYAPVAAGFAAEWQEILDTNVLGLLNLIAAVKAMAVPPRHVIQIGSLAAARPSRTPGNTVYAAAKAAAAQLFREFRTDARAQNMPTKTTLVTPGYVGDTGFTANYFTHYPQAAVDLLGDSTALAPRDIAAAVRYALAQPNSVEVSELVVRPTGQSD